jgi:hypothetical protein
MRNLMILTMAALGLLCLNRNASATPPANASGTFAVESIVPSSFEQYGDVGVIKLNAVFVLDGTFQGPMDSDFLILHFGPLDEPAPELFYAEGRFTGTVNGAAGTLDYVFFGEIDAEGNAQGQLVILGGTGGLSSLRGGITLTGITGIGGTYSGSVHAVRR